MSDLPERLRTAARELYFNKPELFLEAAAEIERLERLAARLERSAQGEGGGSSGGGSGTWDLP